MSQQPSNHYSTIFPLENSEVDESTQRPADSSPAAGEQTSPHQESIPKSLGRYRVVSMLGKGGFGTVYRAVDDQLERDVAIKVTLRSMLEPSLHQGFLTEARMVASLDHPNIVPVYDVGQTKEGDFFVVSKLIDGSDLSTRIKLDRPDRILSLRIIEQIADALHYAHAKGLVHRDVKPANILLDRIDRPYLSDFGIAMRESEERQEGGKVGTPAYMSPEQARGEGHRIDNRSDIYSLGVVLYELLVGHRPFHSDNPLDLMMLVATEEVRSPRLIDDTISQDIERICMKALSRRAHDRFPVARDFAEEIRWVLAQHAPPLGLRPSSDVVPGSVMPVSSSTTNNAGIATAATDSHATGSTRVVPKGLRSFDASDASFFLDLLPGPFDREGLPEILRFWKIRIEETNREQTVRVGLIYGPSGCGKSSLMKAGLLPRLNPKIIPIYLEASSDDTETRLLRAIRKAIPEAEGASLKEILSVIRRGKLTPTGGKLLIVLDQFEQWLVGEKDYAKAALTEALLQCDGEHIQALLMVREDFWISVSRFFKEMEIQLHEGNNSLMVDLFDMEHAIKVLGLFGKAYGKLAQNDRDWSQDQKDFLRQAVKGMSQDQKVISVRIAVLADMMKSRNWTADALNEVGGIEGIGVTFLEEMFGSLHAPIQHRQHQEAVHGLLRALLPTIGTDIKGSRQSADALQKAAGYDQKPRDFWELIGILDRNLRLITPVDEGHSLESDGIDTRDSSTQSRSYQLVHDYLIPSLREWLTQKQRETEKGRSELRLSERAAAWNLYKENKQLPTLLEWLQIRRWTEPAKWKTNEKAIMQQASRYHIRRLSAASVLFVLLIIGAWFLWHEVSVQREELRIAGLVGALTNTDPSDISIIIEQLDTDPSVAARYLDPLLSANPTTPAERRAQLHARMASVSRDPSLIDPLFEELLTGDVSYILPIRAILRPSATELIDSLQGILHDQAADPQRRFRAALALADYVPSSEQRVWKDSDWAFVTHQLVSNNVEIQPMLREALRPIYSKLLSDLEKIFSDAAVSNTQRLSAANAFADYASKDRSRLTELLALATPEQYAILYPLVAAFRSPDTVKQLSQIAATAPPDDLGSLPRIGFGQQRANAAVAMLRLGEREEVLPVFEWSDDPEALTQFIFSCKPRGIRVENLLELLDITAQSTTDRLSRSSQANDHARYALLLAIGEYGPSEIPSDRRISLVKKLAQWYANDPSAGVHGASGWLLRHLGEKEIVDRVDKTPVPYSPDREWYTLAITVQPSPRSKPMPEDRETRSQTSQDMVGEKPDAQDNSDENPQSLLPETFYYTFIVQPAGSHTIGSGEDQPSRRDDETRHSVTLTRPFAILDREITFEELIAFSPRYTAFMNQFDDRTADAGFGPNWYDSVAFCRWLGKEMGLAESDQCYPDPESLDREEYPRDPEETWAPKSWPLDLDKRGFRLPTEAEWESSVRCGARTMYSFGSEAALLNRFGWFSENSDKRVHPSKELRPSARGLFDLHGNLREWVHDFYSDYKDSDPTDPQGAQWGSDRVNRGGGWDALPITCRAAHRRGVAPAYRIVYHGFRLAMNPSNPEDPASTESAKTPTTGD